MFLKNLYFLLILCLSFESVQAQDCNLDFENWETATNANPPSGWQRIESYVGSASGSAYNGSKYGGMNTLGDQWVVEPLGCPGEICFWWRSSGISSDYDVDIDWSINAGTDWNTAHTISIDGSTNNTTYSQTCVDLPEYLYAAPFENILIRFHHSRRNSGSFYFDDVCISEGTCTTTPTQLSFSGLQAGCIADEAPFSYTVCATDVNGHIDNTFDQDISLTATNLSGTLTQTAVSGCSQFTDLQFSIEGTYEISAISGALTGNSPNISVLEDCPITETLKVMSYNLLNFPNGRNDCGANILIPSRWDTLQKIIQEVQPDVLMVCELQTEAGADMILSNALNVNGTTSYARAAFVVNQSPGGTELNNCFFYNTAKMTLYHQSEIATNVRDIGEYVVFMNDPNLAAHNDTTFIDFYDAHLKAGSGQSNVDSRASQCQSLQNYMTSKGEARNALVGGDFNFYTSTETGYQSLLSGTYPFFDPINTPGDWDSDFNFANVHTQSTRAYDTTSLECGATGGMDSRFDFILATNPIMNGLDGVQYVPNSYTTLGNSGNLYNDAINDPANSSGLPRPVLDALHKMSDHLPVILELDITYPLNPLPIELISFEVNSENDKAQIEWHILDVENDLNYCVVEKSSDGKIFKEIGQLQRRDSGKYHFVDHLLISGRNYYRLKIVDWNGVIQYSEIKIANGKSLSVSAYPNPTQDMIHIQFEEENVAIEAIELSLFDGFGKLIDIQSGQASFRLGNYPNGIYTLRINYGQKVESIRILKQ